jgi:hypothetical protein
MPSGPCMGYLKKQKNKVKYTFNNSWDQKFDHGYIEGY